jgi:hypothetical protein
MAAIHNILVLKLEWDNYSQPYRKTRKVALPLLFYGITKRKVFNSVTLFFARRRSLGRRAVDRLQPVISKKE